MTDRHEVSMEDLERMAYRMAQAIPELECPDQCECTWVYHYIERSADLYREEYEWACFAQVLVEYRQRRGGQAKAH